MDYTSKNCITSCWDRGTKKRAHDHIEYGSGVQFFLDKINLCATEYILCQEASMVSVGFSCSNK